MRFFGIATVTAALLANIASSLAAPASAPEDAVVFIEVHIERRDPTTNLPQTKKVSEGSGFLINESGWIATAAHVVNVSVPPDAKLILRGAIRSRHSEKFPLEKPTHGAVASDIALLRFPPGLKSSFPYLCVVKYPKFAVAGDIEAIGFPLGLDRSVRPGKITSLSGPNALIQANLGLARGMSGGPVLNTQRQVVGVVHGGIEEQSSFDYFTPVNMALAVFDTPPAAYAGESCPENVEPTRRSHKIDVTHDDHPGLAPTTREYRITRRAEPGYIIVDAQLLRQSDTRVSDLVIEISEDKRSVDLSFKLTAGPAYDRWRGWLKGELLVEMQPEK